MENLLVKVTAIWSRHPIQWRNVKHAIIGGCRGLLTLNKYEPWKFSLDAMVTNGRSFTIDPADLPALGTYRWTVSHSRGCYYATQTRGKQTILLHRVIMLPPDHLTVDHEDGDGTNDRRYNMRVCTFGQNNANYHGKLSSMGYRGVYPTQSGKFYALFKEDGRLRNLGTFTDAEEAARVRDAEVYRIYGEFATLNFPLRTL